MLRKLALAFVAAASLGAMALTPSTASAKGFGWGWGGGYHHFHGGPAFGIGYVGDSGCYVSRRIMTPYGLRWRTINVCY